MIEFVILWCLLGFVAYVWINYHIYNKVGEVEFGWNDLWILPLMICMGPVSVIDVMKRIGIFKRNWFVLKKKEK